MIAETQSAAEVPATRRPIPSASSSSSKKVAMAASTPAQIEPQRTIPRRAVASVARLLRRLLGALGELYDRVAALEKSEEVAEEADAKK